MTFSWSETISRGKIQQIDAVEVAVLTVCDQLRNRLDHRGIGGLAQHGELGLGIAHGDALDEAQHPRNTCAKRCYRGVIANIGERSG